MISLSQRRNAHWLGSGLVLGLVVLLTPGRVAAQGPTPLAEWQLSAGEALVPFFLEEVPKWRGTAAVGAFSLPAYEGSKDSRVMLSGDLELRYRDIAYASTSEGLGINVWHGKGYRVGAALGLDLGRDEKRDALLRGLGDINPAPELKLYAEKVFFPVVLRAVARRVIADNAGWSADLGAYLPVAGNKQFFVMVGPSLTLSDAHAMQRSFGVSSAQSLRSGLPAFQPDAGLHAANFGVSATWLITDAWFVNGTGASQWLLGSARDSPLVARDNQFALSLIAGYLW